MRPKVGYGLLQVVRIQVIEPFNGCEYIKTH